MSHSLVIGRFQTPSLHPGHEGLLRVAAENGRVLVALGNNPLTPSFVHPLPYEYREIMISEYLVESGVNHKIMKINDHQSDDRWADQMVKSITYAVGSSLLSGLSVKITPIVGKDSAFDTIVYGKKFSSHLAEALADHGVEVLPPVYVPYEYGNFSATDIRKDIGDRRMLNIYDPAEAIIWATQNRYPTAYMCVYVAAFCKRRILLIQKHEGSEWQLPGGFTDPADNGFDDPLVGDAIRELQEETNIDLSYEVNCLRFIGHYRIDDWRYRKERDKINTSLYMANLDDMPFKNLEALTQAGDDAYAAEWYYINYLPPIAPTHKTIVEEAIYAYRQEL